MRGWRGFGSVVAALALTVIGGLCMTVTSAGALQLPQPEACTPGEFQVTPGANGVGASLGAFGACGTHEVSFSGTAAAAAVDNLCSPGLSSLSFVGTEQADNGPAMTATWTLTGTGADVNGATQQAGVLGGLYAVTTQRPDGSHRVGAAVASYCFPNGFAIGPIWVAGLTNAPLRTDVFSCHATASVSSISAEDPFWRSGSLQGAGTCRSAQAAAWQATFTGRPGRPPGASPCQGSVYDLSPLNLTSSQSAFSLYQFWWPPGSYASHDLIGQDLFTPLPPTTIDHQVMLVTSQAGNIPIGVARVQESPDSCSSATSYNVTADWVFINA